jgi:hypothetical protein
MFRTIGGPQEVQPPDLLLRCSLDLMSSLPETKKQMDEEGPFH